MQTLDRHLVQATAIW